MDDHHTTVQELRDLVRRFVDARDWRQFHSPKNLSMALAIEAAELMEHFQWITPAASRQVGAETEKLAAVGEELADVVCYALAIANELEIDVSAAMRAKMRKNEAKYPAAEFRGRYGPEDQGPAGKGSTEEDSAEEDSAEQGSQDA
jgi:NTP pyrophosphatase (non-canonical NTP hydrolase)